MTTRAAIKSAEVTITSDLICPWCWVGLRKLQEASKDANVKANITWKPFMLRPGLPEDGMPKGGEPASRVPHHLKQAGRSVGIDFTGLTDRTPNTEVFHATINFLQDDVKVDSEAVTSFHEVVFEDYYTLGVFPDKEALVLAAKKSGNPTVLTKVESLLLDDNNSDELERLRRQVRQEASEASSRGISGVPSFAFGEDSGKPAFSGSINQQQKSA